MMFAIHQTLWALSARSRQPQNQSFSRTGRALGGTAPEGVTCEPNSTSSGVFRSVFKGAALREAGTTQQPQPEPGCCLSPPPVPHSSSGNIHLALTSCHATVKAAISSLLELLVRQISQLRDTASDISSIFFPARGRAEPAFGFANSRHGWRLDCCASPWNFSITQ